MATKHGKAEYERNKAFFSVLGKRIYFCPRVRVLNDEGLRKVVGRKYDITDDLQKYLQKKYRCEP